MPVSLDKTPQLHLFVAVVTNADTDRATVHHLGLTDAFYYDDQVNRAHDVKRAVPGSDVYLVVAGDRSAGYREALKGDSSDALINPFFTAPTSALPAERAQGAPPQPSPGEQPGRPERRNTR
ncbi:hypothetical protein JHN46_30760 [Streptomyces sp. MBT33]|nr:hypothetical protein [Streptomyces sp. MBT33]